MQEAHQGHHRPRADIDKRFDEKFKELVGDSSVPGFRPGKAPRQIVVRKFNKDVDDQVKARGPPASLEQLAEEHDIAPLAPPNLEPAAARDSRGRADFIYEFEVEVRPELRPARLQGPQAQAARSRTFTDARRRAREDAACSHPTASWFPREGNAEVGDYVIVDMTSRATARHPRRREGDSSSASTTRSAFKDGVAEQVRRAGQGRQGGRQADRRHPADRGGRRPSAAGQDGAGRARGQGRQELRLPELTDEFLRADFGVQSAEQFDELIRVVLERRLEYRQRQSAREQVLARSPATSDWELPRDLLVARPARRWPAASWRCSEAGMGEEEIKPPPAHAGAGRARQHRRCRSRSTSSCRRSPRRRRSTSTRTTSTTRSSASPSRTASRRAGPRPVREGRLLETLAAQLIERKALDLILRQRRVRGRAVGKEAGVGSVEAQTVEGEMKDATAAPPEEKPAEEKPDVVRW